MPCLVCGGGIAGIQASLDLSAAGFASTWSKRVPTIGGSMARLDKTFPTGDCATCIISPKLVECMRDYNIDVLTMADVTRLEGEAGHFKVGDPQAAPRRRRREMYRLRRLLDGLPGAQHGRDPAALPAQRAARRDGRGRARDILARHEGDPGGADARSSRTSTRPTATCRARSWSTWPAVWQMRLAEILRVASFYDRFQLRTGGPSRGRGLRGHVLPLPAVRGPCWSGWKRNSASRPARPTRRGVSRLRTVRCLGLCALSPAMKIDGRSFGRVKLDRVPGHSGAIRMSRPIRDAARPRPGGRRRTGDALSRPVEDPRRLGQLRGRRSAPASRRSGRHRSRRANSGWTPSSRRPAASASAQREPLLDLRAARRAADQLRQHDAGEDPRDCWQAYAARGDLQAGTGLGPLPTRRARGDRPGPPLSRPANGVAERARVVRTGFLSPPGEGHPAELRLDRPLGPWTRRSPGAPIAARSGP